jgi:hypothetical protein
MNIFVDIDNTICSRDTPDSLSYEKSVPLVRNIEMINRLYDVGHTITYWTARGALTGIDWEQLTRRQLGTWGAKYHKLLMGKPHYDVYIDDKSFNTNSWFTIHGLLELMETNK